MTETADEVRIRGLIETWIDGWNRKDAAQVASVFAENVDVVAAMGVHVKGKDGVIATTTRSLDVTFSKSVHEIESLTIQRLRPDFALTHFEWSAVGVLNRDGSDGLPLAGIFTWLVENRDGNWLVRAAQNTFKARPDGR